MASSNQLEKVLELCKNKDFQQQWENLYHHQTMKYVRCQCVELFSENIWQDVIKYTSDPGKVEGVMQYAAGLLGDVIRHFDEKIESNEFFAHKMIYKVTRDDLKKNYESNPFRFIETLARCLKEEELLIRRFTQPSEEQLKEENTTDSIQFLSQAESFEQQLRREIRTYITSVNEEKLLLNNLATKEAALQGLQSLTESSKKRNGVNSKIAKIEELNRDLDTIKTKVPHVMQTIENSKYNIKSSMRSFLQAGTELKTRFLEVMQRWKKQSQFKYVYLAESDYCLMGMENRCKKFGKMLLDLLPFIENDLLVMSNGRWDMEQDIDLKDMINQLYQLFEDICQSTFIVTDQTKHLIKVELGSKKRNKDQTDDEDVKPGKHFKCPKFNAQVRLIATEDISDRPTVTAYFAHEDLLNELNANKTWDELEARSFPLLDVRKTRRMAFGAQGFATFNSLELNKFQRDNDKNVCEEKYRIVFTTEQRVATRTFHFRTLSLPLVITTGASQGSNAHGSLLWQCYSCDDVMQFPLVTPPKLPWSKVSEMLNQKFKTLGGRDLRDDERLHLASRLSALPKSNINGQTEIQFRKFCLDKMMDVKDSKDAKNKSATFWMWVLSVFNLTKVYLKEYWENGFIDGFSDKEESEKKLKAMKPFKNFTFLLRFSDKVITDGQGQNMCGAISVSFVYQSDNGSGDIKVGNAKPFAAEKLKSKNLAKLVKSVRLKEENTEEVSLKWLMSGERVLDASESFYEPSSYIKTKVVDKDYLEFEERLYFRLSNLSLNDKTPKEEPRNDYPILKRSRPSTSTKPTEPTYSTDQMMTDIMLDKYEHPSPSSTLYGGDQRNSHESSGLSHGSPTSSFIMSPDSTHNGYGYNGMSPHGSQTNGMVCASPQSSVDESLSPDTAIPITVLGLEEANNNPMIPVNASYNPAVNNYGVVINGFSQPVTAQHPTLTNLLKNPQSLDNLKKKILNKNSPIQQAPVGEIDLNMVQRELEQNQINQIAMTLAQSYTGENESQMTFAPNDVQMQFVDGNDISTVANEEVIPITGDMSEQILNMVQDPSRAQDFAELFNTLQECMAPQQN